MLQRSSAGKAPRLPESQAQGIQLLHGQQAAAALGTPLCIMQNWSLWVEMNCSGKGIPHA